MLVVIPSVHIAIVVVAVVVAVVVVVVVGFGDSFVLVADFWQFVKALCYFCRLPLTKLYTSNCMVAPTADRACSRRSCCFRCF